ncbi:MAG: glutamine--tRNA ligase/YqeY domain fusion protein [Magnetococcales bacterium]|nr:glutamine--tRNA ligase/YqeY domain fusion protein [Magnetococcales bacterium]MBF0150701.1 glutamine--tRNA ligase/YqeY domain fusion protein [Magnetococcales bacterium]
MSVNAEKKPTDFIRTIIEQDLARNLNDGRVVTRFPPEPNGTLHIGHAKSICLNFGVALQYPNGRCHLRFDDTNPEKEEIAYVQSIQEDVRWLGFDWGTNLFYASDYFERLYELAEVLIQKGLAYVCSLTAEEMRDYRGTLTQPGRESPYRNRGVTENLEMFRAMRAGRYPDGAHTLRAKIDMSSPNINMRDPTLYRIRRAHHHQTGDRWCIYPTYDYTHCISDALEGITHSLCTLEFEDHRPLYDWILDQLQGELSCHPQQIEFSRLELEFTVMSKRMLTTLVTGHHVSGWDDPRLPTISGLRRRGYTPASIRNFCRLIGITKAPNYVEMALLENCLREDLELNAPRAMAVLDPLRVILDNLPEDHLEELVVANHPQNDALGTRKIPLTRELFIERDDFAEYPPKGFKRLVPGGEVRLRNAYVIRCQEVIRNPQTRAIEALRCLVDLETMNKAPEGRKVKGVIHWVSAQRHCKVQVRLYDRLFTIPQPADPKAGGSFLDHLNPDSLRILEDRPVEESLARAQPEQQVQFERLGYFCPDRRDSKPGQPVFNRSVSLRDSWKK